MFIRIGPRKIGIEIDPDIQVTESGNRDAHFRRLPLLQGCHEHNPILVIRDAGLVVAVGQKIWLTIVLRIDGVAHEDARSQQVMSAVVDRIGWIAGSCHAIRSIAPVDLLYGRRFDLLDVILNLAIPGKALKGDIRLRSQAEPQVGDARFGVWINRKAQRIESGHNRNINQDMFSEVRPGSIPVEIDPDIQVAPAGRDHIHFCRIALYNGVEEDDTVLVVDWTVEIIPISRHRGLAIRLRIHRVPKEQSGSQ